MRRLLLLLMLLALTGAPGPAWAQGQTPAAPGYQAGLPAPGPWQGWDMGLDDDDYGDLTGYEQDQYQAYERWWQGLGPEKQKAWHDQWVRFLVDTLPLRQNLAAKGMELYVLGQMPQVDEARVKALTKEIGEMHAELTRRHEAFLEQCRRLGDQG